jgi:hypothetical protein
VVYVHVMFDVGTEHTESARTCSRGYGAGSLTGSSCSPTVNRTNAGIVTAAPTCWLIAFKYLLVCMSIHKRVEQPQVVL